MRETTSTGDAVDLAIDGFADGVLDPALDDEDFFRIELSQESDLMIRLARAQGGLDTEGALLTSDGEVLAVRDDSFLGGDLDKHFIIREKMEAGVYYLRVRTAQEGSYKICRAYTPEFFRGVWIACPTTGSKGKATVAGPYTVSAETVTSPGSSTSSARSLTLDEDLPAGGRIDRPGDADYFSIRVDEPAHVIVRVRSAAVETDGALLDGRGRRVETYIDEGDYDPGGLGFALHASLDTGTSYIRVTAGGSTETGPYAILAFEDTAYASFIDGCSAVSTDYDDPLYGCQWHLNNTGQGQGTPWRGHQRRGRVGGRQPGGRGQRGRER